MIEVLISCALLVIIFASVYVVWQAGDATWRTEAILVTLQQKARAATNGIIRELRQANTITFIDGNITFNVPNSANTVTYFINGTDLIRRHPAATERVICSEVAAADFCCWNGGICNTTCTAGTDSIQLDLALQRQERNRVYAFNLTEKARLR